MTTLKKLGCLASAIYLMGMAIWMATRVPMLIRECTWEAVSMHPIAYVVTLGSIIAMCLVCSVVSAMAIREIKS